METQLVFILVMFFNIIFFFTELLLWLKIDQTSTKILILN